MNSDLQNSKKCKISFDRNGEVTKLEGRICAYEKGFKINYFSEGDTCSVVYDGEKLVQSRRGNVNFEMTFSENERSYFVLGEGGACGKLEIITKRLKVTGGNNKKIIALNYILGEGGEEVNLTLKAEEDKEKK